MVYKIVKNLSVNNLQRKYTLERGAVSGEFSTLVRTTTSVRQQLIKEKPGKPGFV